MPARERAELLLALRCVDAVHIFPTTSVLPLVTLLKPDVLVKGGDYRRDTEVVGHAVVVRADGVREALTGRDRAGGPKVPVHLDAPAVPVLVVPEVQVGTPADLFRSGATADLHAPTSG